MQMLRLGPLHWCNPGSMDYEAEGGGRGGGRDGDGSNPPSSQSWSVKLCGHRAPGHQCPQVLAPSPLHDRWGRGGGGNTPLSLGALPSLGGCLSQDPPWGGPPQAPWEAEAIPSTSPGGLRWPTPWLQSLHLSFSPQWWAWWWAGDQIASPALPLMAVFGAGEKGFCFWSVAL